MADGSHTSPRQVDIDDPSLPATREVVEMAIREGEVVLTRAGVPVARIVAIARPPRRPGRARGMIQMSDDFDEMPEDFRAYMARASDEAANDVASRHLPREE